MYATKPLFRVPPESCDKPYCIRLTCWSKLLKPPARPLGVRESRRLQHKCYTDEAHCQPHTSSLTPRHVEHFVPEDLRPSDVPSRASKLLALFELAAAQQLKTCY